MKLLVTLILLLLTVGRIDATAPNTGQLSDLCVKIEFGEVLNVESKGGWHLSEKGDFFELHYDATFIIRFYDFEYKKDKENEVIGFTWEVYKGSEIAEVVSFTVKHSKTISSFEEGTFVVPKVLDKGKPKLNAISNVVWCIELKEVIDEENPEDPDQPDVDDEDPEIEEPPIDEPPVEDPDDNIEVTDPPEVCHDCDLDDEDEIFVPIDEDDDTEPLPETADSGASLFMILLMLVGGALMITQKK